jgi:hypothetical protein
MVVREMGMPIPGVHRQVKYAILDMFPVFRTKPQQYV